MPLWFLTVMLSGVDWIRYEPDPTGTLSPLLVERDVSARNALGVVCQPNEPRAGDAMVSGFSGPWQRWLRGPSRSYLLEAGFRRDGLEEVVVLVSADQGVFEIRSGPYAHTILHQQSILVEQAGVTIQDCLLGARPGQAFVPEAMVVLPGCVVVLCQRMLDVAPGSEVQWESVGVSLLALQEDQFGSWTWQHLHDGPLLGGDARAIGTTRGGPWCMSTYFPESTDGADLAGADFTNAWIPFVDYMSQPEPHGGQCFLVRATRSARGDAWSFGQTHLVRELLGEMHFHSAGWTPNGLLLSIGDTAEHNAVEWLRCADWDDYSNPDQWTVERVQGMERSDLGSAPAFQFWGVAPGAHANSLLLGADIDDGALYEATLNSEAAPVFQRRVGTHPGGLSQLTHVVGVIRRPSPEVSTKVVFRSFHPNDITGRFGRVYASKDAVHFSSLGQHPDQWSSKSHVTVRPATGSILSVPWYADSVSEGGLRALVGWRVGDRLTRGIRAEPGVENFSGPSSESWPAIEVGPGVSLETGTPNDGVITFADGVSVEAVSSGPVLRLLKRPGNSSQRVLSFGMLREGVTLSPGTYALRCMVQSLGSDPVATRWVVRDSENVLESVQRRLTCADGWRSLLVPIQVDASDDGDVLRVVVDDIHAGRGLFDVVIAPEQLVLGGSPGVVAADLQTYVSTPERLVQPLGDHVAKSVTVIELGVPSGGLDMFYRQLGWKYEIGSFTNEHGESVDVRWDLWSGHVELSQSAQGFQFPIYGRIPGQNWSRESVVHLVLQQSSRGVTFTALAGGYSVGQVEWLAGVAPRFPLDRFELAPELPMDLRAAGVFPGGTALAEAVPWLVGARSYDGLLPAGVSLPHHDSKLDSVSPTGASSR
ncbi:MAG: hypothetical protein CMJ28_03705 [Phycisphaerae bacterium]|nr:hypothetical protein [Phycisphaerae bacterium]